MGVMGLPQPDRRTPPFPPPMERRRADRLDLFAQVELHRGGEVTVLPAINISSGGLLVGVEHGELADLRVGDLVHIFLSSDDSGEPIEIAMDATVVRADFDAGKRSRLAMMWTSTNAKATAQLARLLADLTSRA
jgi:hypothetical protein